MARSTVKAAVALGLLVASIAAFAMPAAATTPAEANAALAAKLRAELPKGATLSCAAKPGLTSISSVVRVFVTYQNERTAPISLWWIDEAGKEVHYANILAGKSDLQVGSFTSFWVIRDMAGRCIEIIQPGTATDLIHIK